MKKFGIIGGAGPLASALFYETVIHESYQLRRSLPEILLLNYPFHRGLTPEEGEENGSLLRRELAHCLNVLERGGVTSAVLVCNTLHLELATMSHHSIHFFPIPDLVLEEIRKKGGKRLLLLGTQNTCLSSLYQQESVMISCPSPDAQRVVDQVIDHLLEGKMTEHDSLQLERVIREFPEEIDGVILGCTDLPVLHHRFPLHSEKPIYDSVKIPARALLRFL
jgi:aspartate racemase